MCIMGFLGVLTEGLRGCEVFWDLSSGFFTTSLLACFGCIGGLIRAVCSQ